MTIDHDCGRYHYGDQTVIRDCCVADAKANKQLAIDHAFTSSHPAYRAYSAVWDGLTSAERALVGSLRPIRGAGPSAGFEQS